MAANKTNPAVSVIMPTYNRTDFIADAIESVAKQTCPVSEIIIVDDGSPSIIRRKLQELSRNYANVKLHHLPSHKGVSHARNFGLSKVQGQYVMFLDDDDTIHPLMVESALEILENHPTVDAAFCQYNFKCHMDRPQAALPLSLLFDYHQLKSYSFSFRPIESFTAKQLAREPLYTLLRSYIAIHSCLLRREAIGNTRFIEELDFGEDKCFWLSLAVKNCVFRLIAEPYATVGRHTSNSSLYSRKFEKKKQIQYYEALVREKLLQSRKSKALTHLKLLHLRIMLGRPLHFRECLPILGAPDVILSQFFHLCKRRIFLRLAFIRFYLARYKSDARVM